MIRISRAARTVPLFPFVVVAATLQSAVSAAIDREAVVRRHEVAIDRVDPEAALSVGNGDFAFTVDATGLQSLEQVHYEKGIPLETLSTWAWHSYPNPEGLRIEDAMEAQDFHGRKILYASQQRTPAGIYFRQNPHPIPLGQISLTLDGRPVLADELGAIDQRLDLWTGLISSRYTLRGQPVHVQTVAHANESTIAVRIESPLLKNGALRVRFRFPYAHDLSRQNKPPLVWDKPESHRTTLVSTDAQSALLERRLDESTYFTRLAWIGSATLQENAPHDFSLGATDGDGLEFVCAFGPERSIQQMATSTFADVKTASAAGWRDYWTRGGIVDFSRCTDPRARELERRVILSQYLVKVNYAGHIPPAETGLTHISWYGKHNTEMYFWHAAQFYQWGRTELLEKGLAWYLKILPRGKADAAAQGFDGVRWPKMTGFDGSTGPGGINPFIIWNQPNPIYLCELVYRSRPERATLEKYQDLVFESAKFLASFAQFDRATGRYVLGPPIKNVSEQSGENLTQNPTFELAYWYYGLQLAQSWRERLGMPPEPKWADILARLSRLPESEGKYVEIETFPELYKDPEPLPTSMLMAYGFLPQTPLIDRETARRTFHEVNRRNGIHRWLSWQLGQGAMTAARLGEPEKAVEIATNPDPAARFMPSGHVRRPKEPEGCIAYLPVNASLLSAIALMCAGWDDAPPGNAPGFPQDGTWDVQWEGLHRMP
jgi:hypothetical protein